MRRKVEGLDTALADIVARTRAEMPVILRLFAEEAVKDIRPTWPVKSGRSANALGVEIDDGGIAITIDVDYASFIHEKGLVGPTYMVRIVDLVWRNQEQIARRVTARLGAI